jgi:hypothetical protein
MPSNMLAAAVVATGVWVAFAVAMLVGTLHGPRQDTWALTSSDKVASHPTLVRTAAPEWFAAPK